MSVNKEGYLHIFIDTPFGAMNIIQKIEEFEDLRKEVGVQSFKVGVVIPIPDLEGQVVELGGELIELDKENMYLQVDPLSQTALIDFLMARISEEMDDDFAFKKPIYH